MVEKNLESLKKAIADNQADFGLAFDADGDRVFLVDEKLRFVGGTILTAMVSKSLLQKFPGEIVQYNAVCGRIVPETIQTYGGRPIRVRVGYSLIKEAMIKNNAIFTGEHSGHFFFRDNYFSDSGLIMALTVLELISQDGRKLAQIVDDFAIYSQSGEINFVVQNKARMMKIMEEKYHRTAESIDWLDGVSIWFKDWWLNLRPSNTEPLLRLNIEADNQEILAVKTREIKEELWQNGAVLK
jgi:phosphomannomutase